jgi:hypothetical protein
MYIIMFLKFPFLLIPRSVIHKYFTTPFFHVSKGEKSSLELLCHIYVTVGGAIMEYKGDVLYCLTLLH